jgi:hypothetical protein
MERKKLSKRKNESESCRYEKKFPHTKPVKWGDIAEAEVDSIFKGSFVVYSSSLVNPCNRQY